MADLDTRRAVPQQRRHSPASTGRTSGADQPPRSPLPTRGLFARLTSIPALLAAFVVFTLLAIGPLQPLDQALDQRWLSEHAPGLVPFFNNVLDRVAGQQVNLTVLALIALTLAWRRWSLRPVLVAIMTEAGFYSVGLMKILFARPAPYIDGHTSDFFTGGLLVIGRDGISYPSGHAAEAVLVYGAAVYLLAAYSRAPSRVVRVARWVWMAIILEAVGVAFLLGYHWVTDLVGGLIFGALLLRTVIWMDRGWRRHHRAHMTD